MAACLNHVSTSWSAVCVRPTSHARGVHLTTLPWQWPSQNVLLRTPGEKCGGFSRWIWKKRRGSSCSILKHLLFWGCLYQWAIIKTRINQNPALGSSRKSVKITNLEELNDSVRVCFRGTCPISPLLILHSFQTLTLPVAFLFHDYMPIEFHLWHWDGASRT